MNVVKIILIVLGSVSLGIGVVGIFVPGLPTTPFLLLTAGLYLRGSDRMYQWVISNRTVGPYISEFQTKKGMTLKSKIISISIMWTMIVLSSAFFINTIWTHIILMFLGLIGTIVMGWIVKTLK